MIQNKEQYSIVVHPGANIHAASSRMARIIVDRWLPNNAGGIHLLMTPKVAQRLLPIFERANKLKRDVQVDINTLGMIPIITEK